MSVSELLWEATDNNLSVEPCRSSTGIGVPVPRLCAGWRGDPPFRDCRAAVRSCSWALPRWGHRGAGPCGPPASELPDTTALPSSSGRSGFRLCRARPAARGIRRRSRSASALVLPAPASGSIPGFGDVVSMLACRGNEVSCRCVPVPCSSRAPAPTGPMLRRAGRRVRCALREEHTSH